VIYNTQQKSFHLIQCCKSLGSSTLSPIQSRTVNRWPIIGINKFVTEATVKLLVQEKFHSFVPGFLLFGIFSKH